SKDLEFAGSFSSALPLAGGKTLVVGSTHGTPAQPADFLVKRYNADGTLDVTFGVNGRTTINLGTQIAAPAAGSADNAVRAAIQPDGKIVVVGSTDDGTGQRFALVR